MINVRLDLKSVRLVAITLLGTKPVVKATNVVFRKLIKVQDVETATDKGSLLALLNDAGTHADGSGNFSHAACTWQGSARSGLELLGKSSLPAVQRYQPWFQPQMLDQI